MSGLLEGDGMNYPTREQAGAAATVGLADIGDEVYLHQKSCGPDDFPEECTCTPDVMVMTAEGWRYKDGRSE